MSRIVRLGTLIVVAVGSATLVEAQRRSSYRLPADQVVDLPAGPGAELTRAQCAACHSLDYVATQPRGKGAKFWQDSVTKMRAVYGADIPDEEAGVITEYLARNFGEPKATPAGHP